MPPKETIDDRLKTLEDNAIKFKVWFQVAATLIVGCGLSIGGLIYLLNNLRDDIVTEEERVDALTKRVQDLDTEIATKVAAAVNGDILAATFTRTGVLAQIQAQAICTSLAVPDETVMAVYRNPIPKTNGTAAGAAHRPLCAPLSARASVETANEHSLTSPA